MNELTQIQRNGVMNDLIMAIAIEAGIDPKKLYKTMTDNQKLKSYAMVMRNLAGEDLKKQEAKLNVLKKKL